MLDDVTSAEDLDRRIRSGVLDEGHHLEAKREVPSGKGANVELARDLASLAVDGGTLVIGVAEDRATRTFSLHPVSLAGLAERAEQVAMERIHPRLTVRIRSIPDRSDPTTGYVLVDVPTSPDAPHMVDGRYYGRGDKTKIVLNDQDVRRLLDRGIRRREQFEAILDQAAAIDPTPEDLRTQAHLFIVALPAHHQPDMLHDALSRQTTTIGQWVYDIVRGAPSSQLPWPSSRGFAPDLPTAVHPSTRANGFGLSTWPTPYEDKNLTSERNLLEIEVGDDGSVRLFTSGVTYPQSINGAPERRLVIDELVPTLVVRTVRVALAVSDAARYSGSWHVGIHVNNVRGAIASSRYGNPGTSVIPYTENEFTSSDLFLHEDLRFHEDRVAKRLSGRFLRGLGVDVNQ